MATGMATRCPACSTIFRVVPDQLRVSEGWVRCGRCAEVFNAAERLVDLDTGAPSRETGDAPPGVPEHELEDAPAATPAAASDFVGHTPPAGPVAAQESSIVRALDPAGHAAAPDGPNDGPIDIHIDSGYESDGSSPQAGAQDLPSFVRNAQRAERWRRPRMRAALMALLVLGAGGLAAQVLMEYRDLVAARFSDTRPLLERACELLGCSVGPPHAIESFTVESSGLVRVEKSNLYKLNVALRNRAGIEVALPALELSLTDGQGKLIARRVLRAAELGVNQATVAAGRELGLQATLQAATDPVAGYTIELFYP